MARAGAVAFVKKRLQHRVSRKKNILINYNLVTRLCSVHFYQIELLKHPKGKNRLEKKNIFLDFRSEPEQNLVLATLIEFIPESM